MPLIVAKRSIVLTQALPSFSLVSLTHMADLVQQNLHNMVAVLDGSDAAVAIEVWRADKAVDDIYNAVFRELMTHMLESRTTSRHARICSLLPGVLSASVHTTNAADPAASLAGRFVA